MFVFIKRKKHAISRSVAPGYKKRSILAWFSKFKLKAKTINSNASPALYNNIPSKSGVNSTRGPSNILKRRTSEFFKRHQRALRISVFITLVTLLMLTVLGAYLLIRSPLFQLKNIEIIGNNTISTDNIMSSLEKYKGQSLFTLNTKQVEITIRATFQNIYKISIVKYFPDRLFISLIEKEPKMVLVNLNGAYVVDEDSRIIEIIYYANVNYPQERLDIAAGLADENSTIVKDIFVQQFIVERGLQTLPEDQRQKALSQNFDYSKIAPDVKYKEYLKLKTTILNEIDSLVNDSKTTIDQSDYRLLPQATYYDNTKFSLNGIVDEKRLVLTLELIHYFNKSPFGYTLLKNLTWKGEILVEAYLSNGKIIKFSLLKKPSEQIDDFEVMISKLQEMHKNFTEIDLSSENISVK